MATEARVQRAKLADKSLGAKVKQLMAGRHFCTLATSSPDGKPHIAGIGYKYTNGYLYLSTSQGSKKARNIAANPNVAVHIAVRKYPVGPPFSIQFTGQARLLSRDDPEIVELLNAGKLKAITMGVLKEPDLCFMKIKPAAKVYTYGLGVSLRQLFKDLAHADRTVVLED